MSVPPLTSARVLSVTSMTNSLVSPFLGFKMKFKMSKSTVAPRLSMLETKSNSFPVIKKQDVKSKSGGST